MKARFILTIILALTMAACGPADIGEACDNDDDCVDGLACVLYGGRDIVNGALECTTRKLCSQPCAVDPDCDSVGSGLICIADCNAGSCLTGSR